MEVKEPVTYRKKECGYIYPMVANLNSLLVYSKGGVGISRLLRFICLVIKHHSKPKDVSFIYEDWSLYVENPNKLKVKIENIIETTKGKLCFVLDEFDLNFGNSFALFLRGLRSKYKDRICYIFGLKTIEQLKNVEKDLDFLIGKNILEIGPLNFSDFSFAASDIAKTLNIKLNLNEIKSLYHKTDGLISDARKELQILSQKKNYATLAYKEKKELVFKLGEIVFLEKVITYTFTKSEEQILKRLLGEKGKLITKDELAKVLSPKTEGEGVSDESIDQVIHRLRKKLNNLETTTRIETITGRGYMIV